MDGLQFRAREAKVLSWSPQPDLVSMARQADPRLAPGAIVAIQFVLTCTVREQRVSIAVTRMVPMDYSGGRTADFGT